MKPRHLFFCTFFLCMALFLTGCASLTQNDVEDTWEESGVVTVGKTLTVQKADDRWKLLNNIDTLTAEGLYYAAWTIGEARTYEDSEGDELNLYDAQLYLLLGEFSDDASAEENMDKWLDIAKTNYEILSEEEISRNGQSYLLITYNCVSEDNPYANGASAFGIRQEYAVCVELTCEENFDEDAKALLIDFLDNCHYE